MKNKGGGEGVRMEKHSRFLEQLFFSKEFSGLSPKRARYVVNGRLSRAVKAISRTFSYTSTRTYGFMMLAFGLATVILHMAEFYFVAESAEYASPLILGAILSGLAIPLILFDKPMCSALQEFVVTDYIFYEFFAIKRLRKNNSVKTIPPFIGIFLGVLPAVIGFFTSVEIVILALLGILFVFVSFSSPELPLLSSVIALPYLSVIPYSERILAIVVAISVLSFFGKVLFGKRVYFFELYDVLIVLFAITIVVAGVIGGGSASTLNAWTLTVLALGYIPVANIIVNRRLVECAINAIMVSAVPVSVIAIVEFTVSIVRGAVTPSASTMSSAQSLAAFLSVVAVLSLISLIDAKSRVRSVLVGSVFVLSVLALITTECIPVLFVLLIAVPAFLIFRSPSIPKLSVILLAFLPLGIFLLPSVAMDKLSSFLNMSPSLATMALEYSEALALFKNHVFMGVGANGYMPNDSYPEFNTPLGIACRFGVFALVAVSLILLLRLRQYTVYYRYRASSSVSSLIDMTAMTVLCLVVLGNFSDIFFDMSLFYAFFVLFGMCTAVLRISRREHEDRMSYYGYVSEADSAVIDITVRK